MRLLVALGCTAFLQLAAQPPPTLEEVRKGMGIPSVGDLRGQQDTIGFTSRAEQMAAVWRLAEAPPRPEFSEARVAPGVVGAICPHDDYLYAGRVYRRVIPLVTARTVVLVGVFHKYRAFGLRDSLVLDPYRAWRAPNGEIKVSELRDEVLAALPEGLAVRHAAAHDREHSMEAIAYWLKHQRPEVEILPVLLPAASFERLQAMAGAFGKSLAAAMAKRGWKLGKDVAVVISADGIHYGADFRHTPHGEGGVEAFQKAMEADRALLRGPLSGPLSADKARAFLGACVDPQSPDTYRMTWCGRFSIPFGMLLLESLAKATGAPRLHGIPVAFGCSVDTPELPVKALGLGATAPANLYHFVSYPGVAFVAQS